MINWVRDCLPEGSRERRTEIRHLAGKEGWLTRRWNARRRLKQYRDQSVVEHERQALDLRLQLERRLSY